jgi:hypothetical protein
VELSKRYEEARNRVAAFFEDLDEGKKGMKNRCLSEVGDIGALE